MEIKLDEQISGCTIIVGPPNFGMAGTIVTEFLIYNLPMKSVGCISIPNLPAVVAIHEGKVLDPIGLFYAKNILVVHIAANVNGNEHAITDAILELSKRVSASKIVCVDGLYDETSDGVPSVWYMAKNIDLTADFGKIGVELLNNGIVTGPGALLLSSISNMPLIFFFASTHSQIPDSAAAASLVAALDEWLNLSIDSSKLLEYVTEFETKWRNIIASSEQHKEEKIKKYVSYVG